MKNVLFIESGTYGGGSFTSLIKHIVALDRNAVQPMVVFFNRNDYGKRLADLNVKVFYVEDPVFTQKKLQPLPVFLNKLFMKGYWRLSVISLLKNLHKTSVSQIVQICQAENIQAIHLNTELFRDRVGLLVGHQLNIPVYSQLRSKYQEGKIFFNPEYIKFANLNVKNFLAVSQDTKKFWCEDVGLEEQKFKVLDDYVQTSHTPIPALPLPKEHIRFVCVANILPVKNHSYLIDCLKNILRQTKSSLILVGKGEAEYVEALETQIKLLNLKHCVSFEGFQKDVEGYIQTADIMMLFSKSEGLPNVVLEAMEKGVLTIATQVGGIPEIITHGENGFMVPVDDRENAEKIIMQVLNLEEAQISEIRRNAKKTIDARFSENAYRKKVARLYE